MKMLVFWGLLALAMRSPVSLDAQVMVNTFSVAQQSDSIEITLTLSEPVTINTTTPCFVDKLLFLSAPSTTNVLAPSYPGSCRASAGNMAVADMDPRDYSRALQAGIFLDEISTFMAIREGAESDFLPSVDFIPVLEIAPLAASNHSGHVDPPSLLAFDVDWQQRLILLHFTDLMDLTNFDADQLILSNPESQQFYMLSRESTPRSSEPSSFVKTVCVTIADNDATALLDMSICQSRFSGCACSFGPDLARNYVAIPVVGIAPNMGLQVSKLRQATSSISRPSSMSVSVDYIGCSGLPIYLEQDEVYLVRPREYITRISCAISRIAFRGEDGRSFDDAMIQEYVNGTSYVVFPGGLREGYLGLYSCSSDFVERSEHYIVNTSPFIGLPEGTAYSTRLYDSLSIPLLFGSDPQLDISDDSNIEIRFTRVSGPMGAVSPSDPEFRRLSPYRAVVYYAQAPYSIRGVFSLAVRSGGQTSAELMNIEIAVAPPFVSIIPSAITLLPNQNTSTLQCVTNSPDLTVFWVKDSLDGQILSSVAELTLAVPAGGFSDRTKFFCAIRDPDDTSVVTDNRVAEIEAVLTNIPEPLSVVRDGNFLQDRDSIVVVNRLSGDLTLRCLGHAPLNVTNLRWVLEEQGEQQEIILEPKDNDDYTVVSYSYNEANLTINNFLKPFRGTLKCQSETSRRQLTFYVVDSFDPSSDVVTCKEGDQDPRWALYWKATVAGARDSQPCPAAINGVETAGFASRLCDTRGRWADEVDVTNCRSTAFQDLGNEANDVFRSILNLNDEDREAALTGLTRTLVNNTQRRDEGLFPIDLNVSLSILEGVISQQESIDVISNLLDESNVLSWTQLNKVARGGTQLLALIERFTFTQPTNGPINGSEIVLKRRHIYIHGRTFADGIYSDFVFPEDSLPLSEKGQVTIPALLLTANTPPFVVSAAIENLQDILPRPQQEPNATNVSIGASIVLLVQIPSDTSLNFIDNIELSFTTNRLARVSNPRCAVWNSDEGRWDGVGVETLSTRKGEVGEYKTFDVTAESSRLSTFTVLVDQEADFQVYSFTVAFYVGCGIVIFSAVLSMFGFLLSCFCDKLMKYSLVSYLTHMSFCCSLVCAYLALIAGLEEALPNMIGCIATSAIIHYFFTAAFAWLLCETLVIIFFPFVSKNRSTFIIFFLLAWGLPVIPTAISLGVIRDQYITTTHCWFYFDGEFVDIVVAFIVPKILFLAMILVCLVISCFTTCAVSRRFKGQSKVLIGLLSFEWFGIVLMVLFLSGSWIFAMLHVNNGYAEISGATAGWVFMGFSIALGVWLFVFGVIVVVINQKVDYQVMWEGVDDVGSLERREVKQSGYALATHLPMTDLAGSPSIAKPAESGAGSNAYAEKNSFTPLIAEDDLKPDDLKPDDLKPDELRQGEFNDSFEKDSN